VKVTFVPEHMLKEGEAVMLTLAAALGLTVIFTVFDVAGDPEAQVAFEVITQVTASLFASAVDVKVALLAPALIPLTFHW
jgi:hypothetical protein